MTSSSLSLRDPAGHLTRIDGRIIRYVYSAGEENVDAVLRSPVLARLQADGRFVRTWELPSPAWPSFESATPVARVLEHEPIFFPSYPVEWTPSMLHAAGILTIELASSLLDEKRGLKDATPLNVLFRNSTPVFVDALSIEPRDPSNPLWIAYGQFVRTFVLPLIASRHLRWSLRRTFTGARDGLTPKEIYPSLSWPSRFRPSILGNVTGPVVLERMSRDANPARLQRHTDPDRARFILQSLFRRLTKALDATEGEDRESQWTSYRAPSVHHPEYHARRKEIVESILRARRPATVLDIGTNDGFFALLAGSQGASVVAIDRDEAVVDRLFRSQQPGADRVLPLVVDLSDPTPASGWQNRERLSFIERASVGFEMVFCLAVLHHLVVGDGLPLEAAVDLLALFVRGALIAEFVPGSDPMCQRLAAGRPIDPARWSMEAFEAGLKRKFTIVARHDVAATGRSIFELVPRH